MEAFNYLTFGIATISFIFAICAFNEVAAIRSEMNKKKKEKKK